MNGTAWLDAAAEPAKAHRLYLLLSDRISSGSLRPGMRIPGEPALAVEHGVSRVTVRRALERLAREGRVQRRAGAGTFVREIASNPAVEADLVDVFAHLKEMGRRTDVKLCSFGYALAPDPVARALNLRPGERTQHSVRVRMIDGAPFSYLTTHVPERIGLTYTEADLASIPLLDLLERSGVTAERASQVIGAALAGPGVAEALGEPIGAPLLSLTRVVMAGSGDGIEHLHALYRPDRFAFHMDLLRTGETGRRRWEADTTTITRNTP
jgi:GntR family transcriptional regulator